MLPVEPSIKTMIEFTHRITSGLSGLMGLALLIWTWRKKSPALRWAAGMFFLLLVEGFIGAVLVKKELVENDASMSRAVVISLHLVNTMLLMLCAVATAIKVCRVRYRNAYAGGLIWLVMAMLVITNATGAVTALGDTIFPIKPTLGPELIAKIREDVTPGQHFLIRLRVVHPIIAAITALVVFGVLSYFHRLRSNRWALAGLGLVAIQVALGFGNIWLGAPGWMQISHLLTAQLLWVTIVAVWLD